MTDRTAAIVAIMSKLEEVFAPFDAKVLEETQVWATERKAAIGEFYANNSQREMGVWAYYDALHRISGGKTWFNVLSPRNARQIAEFVVHNCKATADKRNANIAKKLVAAGVTEVVSSDFANTKDGFNGTFVVNTNAGRKVVTVNTIFAGGYNIQCAHLRVLTKVK